MADLDPITKTIIAEALGEGPEGMRLVGETIINRSQQRGLTPAEIVAQPYQYTGYSNPGPAAQRAFADPKAISAAQAAWQLAQAPGDPTKGANHYYAQNTISTPSWAKGMQNTVTYGGHTFLTDRPFTQMVQAPNPAQVTPTTAALRQMTSPVNGNTALQQYVNERATAKRNQVTPAIPAWVTTMNQKAPTQSGALSSAQKSAAARAALQMNGQSYAGQTGAGKQVIKQPSAFGAFPQGGQIPGANGTVIYNKDQARLNANGGLPAPAMINNMRTGKIAPVPAVMSAGLRSPVAPVPFNRPASFASIPNVGPQMAKVAPVPLQRPNFGMGGPGFAPVNAAAMAIANAVPAVRPMGMMAYAAQPQTVQAAPQRFDASRGDFGYNDSKFSGRGQESSAAG